MVLSELSKFKMPEAPQKPKINVATTFASLALLLLLSLSLITGCSSSSTTTPTEDTSASGLIAGTVGGALAFTNSSATVASTFPNSGFDIRTAFLSYFNLIPEARASSSCPTLSSANGSGCSTVSASLVDLTYSGCTFSTAAPWTGTLQVGDTAGITCGTYPSSGIVTRQFVTGLNGSPSTGTRVSTIGTQVTIDDATANLSNYAGDSIPVTLNGGYDNTVTWTGAARSAVTITQLVYSTGLFNYSINGSLTVNETSGATSRTVGGVITVYHNTAEVKGTSTFNTVTYQNSCCFPTSGSISTSFASTTTSNATGISLNGKIETLSFTGCGTATFTSMTGATSTVTLDHCL